MSYASYWREQADLLQEKLLEARSALTAKDSELAEARAALEPFAKIADIFDHVAGNRPREGELMSWIDHRVGERVLTVEMLRRARTVLSREASSNE